MDTAANGGLKGYAGAMNISMRMGDFGDPLMPTLTTLSYVERYLVKMRLTEYLEKMK